MKSERPQVWSMFDRIAHRYDLLNRLLSFGRDVAWRKRLLEYLPQQTSVKLLDVATGTGDVMLTLLQQGSVSEALGVDMSEKMLEVADQKIKDRGLDNIAAVQVADAEELPLSDDTYDIVSIAFGIRNVRHVDCALKEMVRVLKPGGKAMILEFSLPKNPIILKSYLFYFRFVLPRLGGLISGDFAAYKYLNQTVESFPYGEDFKSLMLDCGFEKVNIVPLTFGVASLYVGETADVAT